MLMSQLFVSLHLLAELNAEFEPRADASTGSISSKQNVIVVVVNIFFLIERLFVDARFCIRGNRKAMVIHH